MPALLLPTQVDTVASLSDTCDGCGAAAKLSLTLVAGGDLAFCGHHANRMADTIKRVATRIEVEEGFDWNGRPAS